MSKTWLPDRKMLCSRHLNGAAPNPTEGGGSSKGLVIDLEAGAGGDPLIQPLPDADFLTLRLYNRRQDKAVSQVGRCGFSQI